MSTKTNHIVVCQLGTYDPAELRTAAGKRFANARVAPALYRKLRSMEGINLLSLRSVAAELKVGHSQIQNALTSLLNAGWLQLDEQGSSKVWTVQEFGELSSHEDFRGQTGIVIYPVYSLSKFLNRDEERQLYLAFKDEPKTAALYRYLRLHLGETIRMVDIATAFHAHHRTIRNRITRLEHMELLKRDFQVGGFGLYFAALREDVTVDENALTIWLNDPASVPVPTSAAKALQTKKTIGTQTELVMDFFHKAMTAAAKRSRSGISYEGTGKVNINAARTLVKSYTFQELMPALLFFVFDWSNQDILEKYGRTLLTFQKHLPAIQEELNDNLSIAPNYVGDTMRRHGLDAFFDVPAPRLSEAQAIKAERQAQHAAEEEARMAKIGYRRAANGGWESIPGWEDEDEDDELEAAS